METSIIGQFKEVIFITGQDMLIRKKNILFIGLLTTICLKFSKSFIDKAQVYPKETPTTSLQLILQLSTKVITVLRL